MDQEPRRYAPTARPESNGTAGRNPVETMAAFGWNAWPDTVEYAAIAITQGLKEIRLKLTRAQQATFLESETIFNDLENDRKQRTLPQKVTAARIYYEASLSKEGYLDKVDSMTGQRETGQFEDGEFRPLR